MANDRRGKAEQKRAEDVVRASQELASAGLDPARLAEAAEASVEAARKLTEHRSVFTLRDFQSQFVRAAGEGWLDHPKWGEFRALAARAAGLLPLAAAQAEKEWANWSAPAHEKAESEMLELAKRQDARHKLSKELVERAIAARPNIAPEQAEAARASCLGEKAVVVTEGTAGAGKSFTLEVIKEVYEAVPESYPGEGAGYDIVGAALSWTAAGVLTESAKLKDKAKALQGLLMEMDQAREAGGSFFKRRSLVIVDEAGLVGTMKMRALLRHAADAPHPVRVLLTGDSLQLNPVEAGNALESIVEECGSARLDTIRRQERESHKAAVKHFCHGRSEQGLWTYWQQEALKMCSGPELRREEVMRDYVEFVAHHPMDSCLVLALENAEVKRLNEHIRERLKAAGLLAGDEHELEVNDGAGPYKARFCVGDRVVFRKNLRGQPVFESRYQKMHEAGAAALKEGVRQREAGLFAKMLRGLAGGSSEPMGKPAREGVFNRSSGIVLGIKKSPSGAADRVLRVLLSEGGEAEIDTANLREKIAEPGKGGIAMHHNFATTIYASQGQTVHRVLMMDSPYMNRRLAYVGMSRHKLECVVYGDASELDRRKRERAARDLKFLWSPREKHQAQEALSAKSFPEADLWAEMALCWNKEAKNPTVRQARRQMEEKRERSAREGSLTGRLRQAEGDDPDDEVQREAGAGEARLGDRERPPSFEELTAEAPSKAPAKRGFFQSLLSVPEPSSPEPKKRAPSDEARVLGELPPWSSEPLAAKALAGLEGVAWGRNPWGEPRLYALDREGCRVGRWGMDGTLRAGRAQPPVLPNAPESPWMVVQGPREALIAWSHFHEKWKEQPERAPSIAVALPDSELAGLSEWLKSGQALHCAWSKRDPASLGWAQETAERLRALGYKASLYPKLETAPEPAAQASTAVRRSGP